MPSLALLRAKHRFASSVRRLAMISSPDARARLEMWAAMQRRCSNARREFVDSPEPRGEMKGTRLEPWTVIDFFRDRSNLDRLRRMASRTARLAGRPPDPDDLCQEVLLRLLRIWEDRDADLLAKGEKEIWKYVSVILRNTNAEYGRKRSVLSNETPAGWNPAIHYAYPAAQSERIEAAQMLDQIVNRLDPKDRTILRFRFWEGLSSKQIAGELGISAATVRQRIHRVLGAIRSSMERTQ